MANNDLNQIRIFAKVAQLKSFTKAAESLAIEKSTVSSKITQLESRLGIRLLQRTTRSVSLTDAGSQYLSYCEQALSALQSGDDYIAQLSQIPTGMLRVKVPENLADFWMQSVIIPFLNQYPSVQLEVIQSNADVDLIQDNFDIAVKVSADEIEDSSLIYRKIYQSSWVLVASQSFIETHGLATEPQELARQPSVGLVDKGYQHMNNQFFHWQGQKVVLKHRFAVNSLNAIITAVKAGLGFAIVPKGMVRHDLVTRQLVEINMDIDIKPTALYIVYGTRTGQPAKLKAFIDAITHWARNFQ